MIIEKTLFNIYKSVSPEVVKSVIPVIDRIRRFKNKPPIPRREKMAEVDFPDFSTSKVIMLHGVSVGEVQSLENLVKKIKQEFPDCKLVITTGTVTGQELANKKYAQYADFITYFPLDVYKTVEHFLNKINPSVILIAETELWPNFFYCAKEKNIPLYIINGRISDKSYPSYLKIKNFFKLILDCTQGVFCQSEIDKERFLKLGSPISKTEVMKNLKFEIAKKNCDIDLKTKGYKVLIAASTHSGEEELIIQIYKKLKEHIKNLKLIIAPRHLTRLDEVKDALFGMNYGLRTLNDNFDKFDVIILDTLGELSKIYDIADVAYIGGSFNKDKTGGHNPLEAIIYSKPVISGPSIKNFRDIYSILEREGAAFVVKNEKELYNCLNKLFTDSGFYKEISANCLNCFESQQGALDFVIEKLKFLK
ncbi:MAG: 3-deoxy-D-manno-octulosonic acid transferase [Candidatus Gastranaerophilales bacterium]|nr:3-deoxy-D-manno-octulosonic acid transferase [Candidatus Gastranaerophilales bacterium]